MAKYTARQIADYFLSLVDEDCGDGISNLKLQKLVYYAQGFYLALHNKPLFKESIVAWEHGPVVPSLYSTFSGYGSSSIPVSTTFDLDDYDAETVEFLNDVYEVYGQFSAWKLRNMTHEESPWEETPKNEIISHKKMKDYFCTLLEN